jgi:hypothetical protein
VLLAFVERLLLLDGAFVGLDEGAVVAGPARHRGIAEMPDARHHMVEEVAVVRHDEHRAAALQYEALQPLERVEVEMVRGLVEQYQVATLQQRRRQRRAPAFAAR